MLSFLASLVMLAVSAQVIQPIEGGKLITDLNGNQKSVSNLQSVVIGSHTINQVLLSSLVESTTNTVTVNGLTIAISNNPSFLTATTNQGAKADTAFAWGPHTSAGYVTNNQTEVTFGTINGIGDSIQVLWGYPFAEYTGLSLALTSIRTQTYGTTQGLNNHVTNTSNPHGVTATQVGAVSLSVFTNTVTDISNQISFGNLVVRDTSNIDCFWRFEGTNAVQYELGAVTTNYTVTLSADFLELTGNTRPAWTNNVWPFTDNRWASNGELGGEQNMIIVFFDTENFPLSSWENYTYTEYPVVLQSVVQAQGSATVYQNITRATNATGNTIGPVPTNLVTQAALEAWLNARYYTAAQIDAAKELHFDSYTNVVWRDVWSNGWRFAVAYTNTP